MNGNKSRGMPDMTITPITEERIKEETRKIPEKEMFQNPNVKVEVKVLDDGTELNYPKDEPVKKQKRKLTDKQLEALARGRQTSMKNRQEKAKNKKTDKKVKIKDEPEILSSSGHAPTQQAPVYNNPPPTPVYIQQQPNNHTLDYDKIIQGLADENEKRHKNREDREHKVAEDITAYENKIREDERSRIWAEVEAEEKREIAEVNEKKTKQVFTNTIPVNSNYNTRGFGSFSRSRKW